MIIFPAIDIKGGKCVRLIRGDFGTAAKVADSYMDAARGFVSAGAEWIHMVDLDGAKGGKKSNKDIFLEAAENIPCKIQIGGGIRSLETAEMYLSGGVSRIIIGSAAVKNPELVRAAVREFGARRVAVGVDAKNGFVATDGWLETSSVCYLELAMEMGKAGVRYFIFTDIDKDGTLSRPNHGKTKRLQEETGVFGGKIIASGGIKTLNNIKTLKKNNIYGAICGKSLYSGTLNLKEAIAAGK
ncbi:MAG: 1-(5-phosphoribosyl)-5-[(5-phosphoribosylamino)methylideneamino]imidazole-4-carboxamide isomerase [Oscillospiraceae bacterium]|jgi:phosphoribosylformimino-5-aminoimidazole carboxamide ribotide isomerase|nr:1-(5-phosphoribosyl)-5-[(5-phosphoribosylamino)methylideneamino]imidazole-4-carboxamide isomerase [Oscillospiraceae bacterium]